MLSPKQIAARYDYKDRLRIERLKCTKCGAIMTDCEPYGRGEFNHPNNDCVNKGKSFYAEPTDTITKKINLGAGKTVIVKQRRSPVSGLEPVGPKKYKRAKKRGAKTASKHRPR